MNINDFKYQEVNETFELEKYNSEAEVLILVGCAPIAFDISFKKSKHTTSYFCEKVYLKTKSMEEEKKDE